MRKEEIIKRYGEAAWEKHLEQVKEWNRANPDKVRERVRKWQEANPEKMEEINHDQNRKGGSRYEKTLKYNTTGLRSERKTIRGKHQNTWREYKKIIAPDSEIHHDWISETAEYRGVALVEKDQHQHGIIDVIKILEGEITLLTEEEIREQEFSVAFFTKKEE